MKSVPACWLHAAALLVCTSTTFAEDVTLRQLVEVVDISGPVLSPDGGRVAFRAERASVERNNYDSVWYIQGMDDKSQPIRIADGGVPLRDSAGQSFPAIARWSPDGRWLYFRAQVGGKIDVWRAATDGSGAAAATLDEADVRGFSLSDDGRVLKYSVGASRAQVTQAETAEYDRGVHIDETVPIGQNLYRSGYVEGRLETQRFGGVWFDRAPLLADVPDRWRGIDLSTGRKWDLAAAEVPAAPLTAAGLGKGQPDAWKLAREPRTGRVALLSRVGDGSGLLEKPDVELSMLPNGHATRSVKCAAQLCTRKPITEVQWRPNSDEVLFTVTDPLQGQAQSIFGWNVVTGDVREIARSRGLINGGREPTSACDLSALALVCVTAKADRPPRLERVDLKTGSRRVLFEPNAALALQIERTAPSKLLRWTDEKGRQFGGVYFPAHRTTAKRSPLFVAYYNCAGFQRGAFGDEWPLVSLAEHGISTLCIDHLAGYRLKAVERYDAGLGAIKGAIDLLASEGEIDRTKVGVGGLSFGAEVSMWVATESLLAAAVSVSTPVISMNYYQFGSMKGAAFSTGLKSNWQLGSPEETPQQWRVISPSFKLDRIAAPILFQMPEQEYMFSLDYVIPLLRERRADLYVFPDEPHIKFQPKHKLAVYTRNLDWFRFWLQNLEDPDPEKKQQYAFWRLMKAGASAHSKTSAVQGH